MFWNLPMRRKLTSKPHWLSKASTRSLSIFSIRCSTTNFYQDFIQNPMLQMQMNDTICWWDSIFWHWVFWDSQFNLYSSSNPKSHQESFRDFAINPTKLHRPAPTRIISAYKRNVHQHTLSVGNVSWNNSLFYASSFVGRSLGRSFELTYLRGTRTWATFFMLRRKFRTG